MQIQIKNLVRNFGATKAVNDISFSFSSGDVFGFVGPNGAGKTTTLRIMATLDEPTSGDVFIDGDSVKEMPEAARHKIGFVPDSLPTHADVTVHEYLDFFARAYGLQGKARHQAVGRIEEFTGVTGLRDKLLKSLSKGMKQRVSVGRALVHNPTLLLMDEPAAGLDPRARVEFRELVTLLAKMGKAVLISSHILTELTEVCNGVVIIERGELLETGSISDVMERSRDVQVVAVRTLDDHDLLHKALLEFPHVENVRNLNRELHVELTGQDDQAASLLSELIRRKHRIAEFRHVHDDLEDIFMKVTTGEVQ
jgi:ABC-2 type transport system ATP-binding protein